jgi:hypothetical protein
MKWIKKGLIYKAPFDGSWKDNSALTPQPFLLNKDVIRIYASFRDKKGVGRIGYVDVSAKNPSDVLTISDEPVLDIGKNGTFDDNGVILGDVLRVDDKIYMYYVGFQLVKKVKFLAYAGLAISNDNGKCFKRYKHTPILDRSDEALYIRAIHSVLYENDIFRVYYAAGNDWEKIGDRYYPRYDINYIESKDGINIGDKGIKIIANNTDNLEYRIGRPKVYKLQNKYIMFFTYGTIDGKYMAGYAESDDGIKWIRKDKKLGLSISEKGWDSKHIAYPTLIKTAYKTYLFYNGNNMGYEGFGYAELESD